MDGEETEIQPVGEAMTGCWMTAGEHQITMRYTPQGFVEGAAISVISLLILVLGIAGKCKSFSADIIGKCNKFLTNFYKKIKKRFTNREFVIYHFEEKSV